MTRSYLLAIAVLAACNSLVTQHPDLDGDGFCTPPGEIWDSKRHECLGEAGFGDCDDANVDIAPGVPEDCEDGVDNNCNGEVDEIELFDGDGDGASGSSCPTANDDCNDSDDSIFPGAAERCDGIDNDCDDETDEGLPLIEQWIDGDGDGFGGVDAQAQFNCAVLDGHASTRDDCDDLDADVHPGAGERCNLVDDDCNGTIDDGSAEGLIPFAPDLDGDGFGSTSSEPILGCAAAEEDGWSPDVRDCDDTDASIHPDQVDDTCDGVDDNCSGEADEQAPVREYWEDNDGDGYGAGEVIEICEARAQSVWATRDGDCDDLEPAAYPQNTPDLCDGIDEDCDSELDEDATWSTYYLDSDGDGYGGGDPQRTCLDPAALGPSVSDDCEPSLADVHPGADEVLCDGFDQDCDGADLCRAESFWASGTRATSALSLGPELAPAQTTCGTSARTWMSERAGYDDTISFTAGLRVPAGGRIHVAWSAPGVSSVSMPALGLTALPSSGTIDVPSPFDDFTLELMSDSDDSLGSIPVTVEPPTAEPQWRGQCDQVPHPLGIFPGAANHPVMDAPVAWCAVDPLNVTSPHDPSSCCNSFTESPESWLVTPTSLTFDATVAGGTGARVHRVHGFPTTMLPGSPLTLDWDVTMSGHLWYRVGLIWDLPSADLCDLDAHDTVTSTWMLDNGLQHWDFGPGRNSTDPAFPTQGIGTPTTGTRVIPFVEVYLPEPVDTAATLVLSNMSLYCCGPNCGTCNTDFDMDRRGAWCTSSPWDCDEQDAATYPGATSQDCADASWWLATCPT